MNARELSYDGAEIMARAWVEDALRSIGIEFRRIHREKDPGYELVLQLQERDVVTVLDIGANTGQFAGELFSFGYHGRIVSFEPLGDAHGVLVSAADKKPNWVVHSRCAIGDEEVEVEINVSKNSVSSSILPMLEAHRRAEEASSYINSERVPCHRLDTVAPNYVGDDGQYFIKIDTQGFEWQVLSGGSKTIKGAKGVQCELSLTPLYEGQRLWLDIIGHMEAQGFELWDLQPVFKDSGSGRLLQADALFFRK